MHSLIFVGYAWWLLAVCVKGLGTSEWILQNDAAIYFQNESTPNQSPDSTMHQR